MAFPAGRFLCIMLTLLVVLHVEPVSAGRFLCIMLTLLVVLHVEPVSDPQVIKAKPGENVTLPCQAPKGDIALLAWNRTKPKTEKYVAFYRDNRFVEKFQDSLFQGRVELKDPKLKGDASVVLKNITTGDSGIYECRIVEGNARRRKRDGPKLISTIHLKIEDPGPTAGKQGGNLALTVGLPVCVVFVIVLLVAVLLVIKLKKLNFSSFHSCYSRTHTENQCEEL